ncbi:helix-turn-helix transcriptional regulator [Plantactinospora sp. BB1]|uniref:ArsR/SmtB family transcription factor n=1 Tax=Plantactinospora sp. BB1 TaxID=2071627 RepID=UPI000D172092|nr:metalloregulator ArsR/SmtB family transcription factor [Plantactinospora sp. BB1]AVT39724.1 transcriptional regulator [Plantactinospora sp. BB1]
MARDTLTVAFAALADPTRRAILDRLLHGDASVTELAEPFAMTPRAVSKHVAVLEAAGLVTRARDAQRRPSRIRAEPLADIDAWLGAYRRLWQHRFDQLDERLAQLQGEPADRQAPDDRPAPDERPAPDDRPETDNREESRKP